MLKCDDGKCSCDIWGDLYMNPVQMNPDTPGQSCRFRGFVQSDGEDIYAESFGEGDSIVLIHGLGGNHVVWYQQVPRFSEHHRVITWDLRGFGRSSNHTNRIGPAVAVSDLLAILDHLEIKKTLLIGQSMGGWVAMGFALAFPERVNAVVLSDTIAGIYTPTIQQAFNETLRQASSLPDPSCMPPVTHPALGKTLSQNDPEKAFLYTQIGGFNCNPPPDVGTVFKETAYPQAQLEKIDLPVLFIVGEEDPIFPPDIVKEAAAMVPGSRIVIIPGTGHSPYYEAADIWNVTVLDFISSQTSRS